ncbi:MAG TPA: M28 family peptidase [Mycobacterium sp.]|nr:M28 family peptidase [Mycobacterium sp.]
MGIAGLVALLLIGIASVLAMAPTPPAGHDAPAEAFGATRAMTHISAIADEPRPVGSAKHDVARAYLLEELGSLGWRTEVQESIGMFDFGADGTQSIAAVANVIATRPGTASTGTVLLTAHYDTVAGSPGAGDDGIGVGVLLETARALSTVAAPRNTVMILLTDAEEVGLLGAEAFVRERSNELGTTVVLNHEARGAGGAPMTFRMSSPNTELVEVLAGAPGAFADSSSEASFEALPNDTDFTPFAQAGLHGYDTAIIADSAYYHSPIDDPAHLSAASLQQMGDTTLTLTHELASTDLSAIQVGGEQIVTTLPWGLLWYPQSLEIPLAIGLLILTAVLVWVLRRQGALTLPRAALSAAASVVLLVAAGAASYAVWRLALLIDPAQASVVVGEPYRPVLYRLAILLSGLAVALSLFALVGRRLGAVGLAVGMLVVLAVGGVLLAFTLPGLSGSVVQPALVVATGAAVASLLPERRTAARGGVYLLALAVAAIMLGPAVWIGFDIGLSAGPVSAVLFAVFVTLALPLIEAAWPLPLGTVPRRRVRIAAVPVLLVALTAAFAAAGLVVNREGATDARQETVVYSVDADTKEAHWASGAMPASDWSRSLLSEPAVPLEDAFPWSAGAALWHGSAPAADLSPPAVTVLRDVNRGGTRELTLRLSSRRGASTIGLWVDAGSATIRSASVAGRDVPTDRSKGRWAFGFRFSGAPADGVEVRLELDQHANGVTVRVADSTHDLGVVPGFTPPPGRVLVTPEVVVTRTLTL